MQSSSTSVIFKILAVFFLFCMSKASGGTCLSYGHSCWGGHGKRSNAGHLIGPATSQKRTNEWYISRLFNPSIGSPKKMEELFKSLTPDSELDKYQQYKFQIYPVSDVAENNLRLGYYRDEPGGLDADSKSKWGPDTSESEEEVVVLTPEPQQFPFSKFRLFQIMNQEDSKKREAN